MIVLGILLILLGLVLAVTGFFGVASIVQILGWIVLAVGIALALIHAFGNTTRRHAH